MTLFVGSLSRRYTP